MVATDVNTHDHLKNLNYGDEHSSKFWNLKHRMQKEEGRMPVQSEPALLYGEVIRPKIQDQSKFSLAFETRN